jgi:lipid-binding SYLF domain-containing protein
MDGHTKYLMTARLGEGVIYTRTHDVWNAAVIIKQHSPTVVDLFIILNDGTTMVELAVEFDTMAEKPRTWANRVKT